jgi:hypothetical protein
MNKVPQIVDAPRNVSLDLIDFQILQLLSNRQKMIEKEIFSSPLKMEAWDSLLITDEKTFIIQAKKLGLKTDFTRRIYRDLLHYGKRLTKTRVEIIPREKRLKGKKITKKS